MPFLALLTGGKPSATTSSDKYYPRGSSQYPQLVWTLDDHGKPIFSSQFLTSLVLSRRIALHNAGSLPVWVLRVGFRWPGSAEGKSEQCSPHLGGFSVVPCGISSASPKPGRPTTPLEGQEWELKPDEERWLEVIYSPDFLHPSVSVELCLFASLRASGPERPNWSSMQKRMDLKPWMPSRISGRCNSSVSPTSSECSVFELEPVSLTARISAPLAKLCHSSLIRPPIEEILW